MQTNTTAVDLTSQDDLGSGNDNQNETQHVEQIPDGACASWMASDDATVRCVAGGLHQPSLERVVDPLPNADKHDPQAEQQRMCVGDTTHVDGKAGSCTRCAKCHKEVVPVLDLEPGVRFVAHQHAPLETAIVLQGGAA